jgi:N-methylhydantoinase A
VPAAVLRRDALAGELAGPAIVEEQTATTVVPPGWTVRAGEAGVLLLARGA